MGSRIPHASEEENYVLPPPCDRMDDHNPDPFVPFDQVPSYRARLVESGDGPGALLCSDRCQRVSGHVAAPQRRHGASAVARVLL
jgi:hypothetical protein